MFAQYKYIADSETAYLIVIKNPHNPRNFRRHKFLTKPHYNKESLATQNVLVAYRSEHNAMFHIRDLNKGAAMSSIGIEKTSIKDAQEIAVALGLSLFVVLNSYCMVDTKIEIYNAYFWLGTKTRNLQ